MKKLTLPAVLLAIFATSACVSTPQLIHHGGGGGGHNPGHQGQSQSQSQDRSGQRDPGETKTRDADDGIADDGADTGIGAISG